MVNNNGIPIEVNKKPFETVYELKDEIPSFEEFMKDYKVDENLNYDDLSSSSVGEVKGYGPCSEGGCSYENKECQCYIGQFYVPLYLVCPVPKFQPPYYCSDTTAGQWYHKDCGGRMFINIDLNVKCMKYGCGKDGSVENWTFACATHPGKYDYAGGKMLESAMGYLNNVWQHNHAGRGLIAKMIDRVIEKRASSSFRYS